MQALALILVALLYLAHSGDTNARLARSTTAKANFKRLNPCPSNNQPTGPCPGHVIDHIIPLACGGADAPSNMQWQTIADAKAKDRWERKNCPRSSP